MVFTRFFATFAKRKYLNFKMMLRWSQGCQNGAKNGAKVSPRWVLDAHVGVKMALRWATRRLLGASWPHLGAKMANLARFWQHLGDVFLNFGGDLAKLAKTKKTTTVHHFWKFFGVLGLLLEAILAHLSAMLAHVGSCWRHLGAILEQLGDKMVNLAGFWQYLGDFF